MVEGYSPGPRLPQPCDKNSWQDADLLTYVRRPRVPWTRPPPRSAPFGNDLHLCRVEPANGLTLGTSASVASRGAGVTPCSTRCDHPAFGWHPGASQPGQPLSLDADSWAWVWNVTLIGAEALALVLPSALGEPVTLEATIDGNTWHLVVEDWQEDRQFAACAPPHQRQGHQLAWLGRPTSRPTSGTLENARTLAQAMRSSCPWRPAGPSHWAPGTPDWSMPSGSWNWVGTRRRSRRSTRQPRAVGLVVVPSRADQGADHPAPLPRAALDAIPPRHQRRPRPLRPRLGHRLRQPPPGGADPGQCRLCAWRGPSGIIARVWRTQTAGDRLAATVSADPITHADAARLWASESWPRRSNSPR